LAAPHVFAFEKARSIPTPNPVNYLLWRSWPTTIRRWPSAPSSALQMRKRIERPGAAETERWLDRVG